MFVDICPGNIEWSCRFIQRLSWRPFLVIQDKISSFEASESIFTYWFWRSGFTISIHWQSACFTSIFFSNQNKIMKKTNIEELLITLHFLSIEIVRCAHNWWRLFTDFWWGMSEVNVVISSSWYLTRIWLQMSSNGSGLKFSWCPIGFIILIQIHFSFFDSFFSGKMNLQMAYHLSNNFL